MPTIEENLAHLSFLEKAEAFVNPLVCASHLRAALDREAALTAERNAARAEAKALRKRITLMVQAAEEFAVQWAALAQGDDA